ncbi:MAG: zinc carboxypeptidase [Bacteroidetes bacterium]|nr:zinc carboxypeptidase [Bacteroidota bacterium]
MRKSLALLVSAIIMFSTLFAQEKIISPDEFLPHALGEQFTPHHLLLDYFEYVAEQSDQVVLQEYGRTNQQRPLLLAFVSTKENISNLEEIRLNNLRRTGLIEGEPDENSKIAIIWLSYSVHGNEASGSESSMAVLHELIHPSKPEVKEWLKNTLVIIDPSVNPDGYDRYTHWFRNVSNRVPPVNSDAREHQEPWPGGRVNHYYFDLNRDWAWLTQKESQQRIKAYHKWMPHVHPDIHEQGINNPYYFAPAAQPYLSYITDWQRQFQLTIGKNNAYYFDQNGWLYFTKEIFDLLYPGYGDTYPSLNGAIGMTYEQAGGGRAARAVTMENKDTLTLSDRILHHKTTSLATIEVSSKNAVQLVGNFQKYFSNAKNDPPGIYKTYIIKNTPQSKGYIKKLCSLLDQHGIEYGSVNNSINNVVAFSYIENTESMMLISEKDLLISTAQPMGVLASVLFDPAIHVTDYSTYDITAWALPYAYGLDAYATSKKILVQKEFSFEETSFRGDKEKKAYAYLLNWHSLQDARLLSALLQKGFQVRFAEEAFQIEGNIYSAGTLVITRADNRKRENFDKILQNIANEQGQQLIPVQTGFVDSGPDFGSGSMRLIETPNILVLSGNEVYSNAFGSVWHYFEQELEYPITPVNFENFNRIDLDKYQLLVIPEGRIRFSVKQLESISKWVSDGGRVIAIGRATQAFENKKGFSLTPYANDDEKKRVEQEKKIQQMEDRLDRYEDQDRKRLSNHIPGAIVKLKLDNSHPLAFGMPDHYFSLKRGSRSIQLLKNAWNVGFVESDPYVVGYIGEKALENMENTAVFAVEDKGRGCIVYLLDDPLYRAFWEQGLFLFSNAVFFAGQ